MTFEPLTVSDLPALEHLKPLDWSDILTPHQWYLSVPFCHPCKAVVEGKMVGIGTSIHLGNTGWLAHVIVHPEYRCQGVGRSIVRHLKQVLLQQLGCKTISLIATDLGFPVYLKEGFTVQADYSIYWREQQALRQSLSHVNIQPYSCEFESQIFALDRDISGEERAEIIRPKLGSAELYCDGSEVQGIHLGALGEGLIIAKNPHAGIALLEHKIQSANRIYVPSTNEPCAAFLRDHEFNEVKRIHRMILGEPLSWKANCMFTRAAGYLG